MQQFDSEVSILEIHQIRHRLQYSSADLLQFLLPKFGAETLVLVLLWILEFEYDVLAEIEEEGRGSLTSDTMFVAFHHVTRHIGFCLKSGYVPADLELPNWAPTAKCSSRVLRAAYKILFDALCEFVKLNKPDQSLTSVMSPARVRVWGLCLKQIYRF